MLLGATDSFLQWKSVANINEYKLLVNVSSPVVCMNPVLQLSEIAVEQ